MGCAAPNTGVQNFSHLAVMLTAVMARSSPCCSTGGNCSTGRYPDVEVLCSASRVIENEERVQSCRVGACTAPVVGCCAGGDAVCRVPFAEAARAIAEGSEDGCGSDLVLKCSSSQVSTDMLCVERSERTPKVQPWLCQGAL